MAVIREVIAVMSSLSVGYIRNPLADWFWFILLPPLAIGFALLSEAWLSFVALASVNLWITVPHHFGTWCRTYGLREDWQRFRSRVVIGPIVIVLAVLSGLVWAPLTIFLVTMLWDHQHSVMQQHGLARIYDFKAQAGGPQTGKLDLWLNIVLFVNHLVTVPLWTEIWVQQCYTWRLPIDAPTVQMIQAFSYLGTGCFVIYYLLQLSQAIKSGYKVNPMKYAFLLSSYALWYYAGWHTDSILVYGVAHRIMHGLQYLVIVYWFLERKHATSSTKPWMLPKLNVWFFAIVGLAYSLAFQLLLLKPLSDFGFGLPLLPASPSTDAIAINRSYEIYAATLIASTALIHYYFDSFIWKIRDEKTQQGL
ncbi:MAG: hypothetical protein R3C53_21375 [Pirellulaceae bacterium]